MLPVPPAELPSQCVLNPKNNLYFDQEFHKIKRNHKGEWQCGYCRKVNLD